MLTHAQSLRSELVSGMRMVSVLILNSYMYTVCILVRLKRICIRRKNVLSVLNQSPITVRKRTPSTMRTVTMYKRCFSCDNRTVLSMSPSIPGHHTNFMQGPSFVSCPGGLHGTPQEQPCDVEKGLLHEIPRVCIHLAKRVQLSA